MKMLISYVIDTDNGDPSTVLDCATSALPNLLAHLESYGDTVSGDDNDISVQEVE